MSDSYPYAHRTHVAGGSANYARAAVQATVDAYSGRIRLYAADRTDPILRAWDAAFPGMFEPVSGMPPGVRRACATRAPYLTPRRSSTSDFT